MPRWSI